MMPPAAQHVLLLPTHRIRVKGDITMRFCSCIAGVTLMAERREESAIMLLASEAAGQRDQGREA